MVIQGFIRVTTSTTWRFIRVLSCSKGYRNHGDTRGFIRVSVRTTWRFRRLTKPETPMPRPKLSKPQTLSLNPEL